MWASAGLGSKGSTNIKYIGSDNLGTSNIVFVQFHRRVNHGEVPINDNLILKAPFGLKKEKGKGKKNET